MAWAASDQRQPFAVMEQLLMAGDAPEREDRGIGWWIFVRVKLHHRSVAGQPGRMRVARIQGRVFQQAQAPALRRFLCRLRPATMAQPVEPVVGVPAQVLPGERKAVQMQHVQIRGSRIPRLGGAVGHDATSWEQESPPRLGYALHRHRQNVMGKNGG